jgi:hypothetical protein
MENEEGIADVVEAVRKTVEMLAPSVPILPPTVSPELKARISTHVSWVVFLIYSKCHSCRAASWRRSERKRPSGQRRKSTS